MSAIHIRTGDARHRLIDRDADDEHRPYAGEVAGWLRLIRIDLKRADGPWIVPFALLFAGLTLRDALTPGVAVWPEITNAVNMMAMPLVILAVAIGALSGGRERRREVAELTSTTAMIAWRRYLSIVTSTFLWAFASYTAFAAAVLTYGALRATWGGPEWGVIVVPIPVLALGAAFGVMVGRVVRDRTAPAIAIALFLLIFVVAFMPRTSTSVLGVFDLNGWFDPVVENVPERPFSVSSQLAWSVGLVGFIVGFGILWERRTALSSATLLISTAFAIAGAVSILSVGYQGQNSERAMWVVASVGAPQGSVCNTSGPIGVCVHPAYEGLLPGVAEDVNTWLAPVAGLPGVVDGVYITSRNEGGGGMLPETDRDVRSVNLAWEEDVTGVLTQHLWPSGFRSERTDGPPNDTVQYVVMTALAREIGVDDWPEGFFRIPDNVRDLGVQAAIDRFAALSLHEQRAWLEANWDDLSSGRLTLEDLP